jgi:hypothetical protein
MKKRTYNSRAAALILVLVALSLTRVLAVGLAQAKLPAPSSHISDFAAVVGTANKEHLEAILENLKTRTDIDLVIAVVKTAGTEDLYGLLSSSGERLGYWIPDVRAKTLVAGVAADTGKFFTQFSRPRSQRFRTACRRDGPQDAAEASRRTITTPAAGWRADVCEWAG